MREKAEVPTSVTAKRLKDGSLIIVAHNSLKRISLDFYRSRWSIETLFRSFKTNQFNRSLARLGILAPGKEKIYEEPACRPKPWHRGKCTEVHEDSECIFDEARGQKNCFPKWSIPIIILCFFHVLHHAPYISSHFPIPFIIKAHGYPHKSFFRSLFDRIYYLIFDHFIHSRSTVDAP